MSILNWFANILNMPGDDEFPPWVISALMDVGVVEYRGDHHNSRILEYHKNTTLNAKTDEVPWCASAVSTWLKDSGMEYLKTAWSKAYIDYGEHLDEPKIGCIVIFWRESKDSYKGHVGFYMGKIRGKILVLGGNQNDAVTISEYDASRLLAYRWPVVRSE